MTNGKKLGWTNDSGMIARYTHLIYDDVIDATLEKIGQEVKKPFINIKTAEPLDIINSGMQLQKLAHDNEELKNKIDVLYDLIFTKKEGNLSKRSGMTFDEIKSIFK